MAIFWEKINMKQTVHSSSFVKAFATVRPNNFTIDALYLMFDAFMDYERDTGHEIELDVIAICCEFEQCTIKEVNRQYDQEFEDMDEAIDWLHDKTWVLCSDDDWIVFQQF
jgi:hypothetical protein